MPADWPHLIDAGLQALRRGDAAAARSLLEPMMTDSAPPSAWLLLADARGRGGDSAGEEAALDRALAIDPRFVPALLAKGDIAARRGDDRAAVSFFSLALSSAPANSSPQLQARLEQAARGVAAAQERFARHLEAQIDAALPGADRPPRFVEALDILTGRKPVQLQQPTSFFYPGLRQQCFYQAADFAWAAGLEARAPALRAELEALLTNEAGFAPYVQRDPTRPNREHALLDDPSWSALYLWRNGQPVEENARRCPQAMAALEAVPLPHIPGRAPTVLFSMLRPRTHIPPHWGMLNTRLIAHLPLIVPNGCRLRVGNHVRTVEQDRLLIFDDSINHEAWNDSDEVRIVLLFELWHPDLDEGERQALTAMFGAINLYGEG